MWKCFVVKATSFRINVATRELEIVYTSIPDPSSYRQAVCRIMTRLGDILTGFRRRSWIGDRIWSEHFWGFYMHEKLKDIILFGRTSKGTSTWCKDGERYRF